MTMMKKIIATILPAVLCVTALAQNLNPTVDITNTYVSKAGEGAKVVPQIQLPDSLTQFNYNFDYSVFDAPYKGAFEFSPYSVNFSPDPTPYGGRTLFVRAGAGYTLHPQLQAVWSPLKTGKVRLNLHQDFHGYYGRYRTVRKNLTSSPMVTTKGDFHNGYDFCELFGADGRFNLGPVDGGFGVDYNGIFTQDEAGSGNFHSVKARVAAGTTSWDFMNLGGSIAVDFATDQVPHAFGTRKIDQGGFDLNLNAAPNIKSDLSPQLDLRFLYVGYSGTEGFADPFFGFVVTPHIKFEAGPVRIDAGVRLDGTRSLNVAPAVNAAITVVDDLLDVYASATGGTKFNTFSDFIRTCHWYSPIYSETMKNSFSQLDARLGLRGVLFKRLQYDLSGGWTTEKDKALWGVKDQSGTLSPRLGFRNVNFAFADLMLAWKSEHIDADGGLHFRKSQLDGAADVFDLPLLTGDFRVMYNWKKRVYAGVRADFSTGRNARVSGIDLKMQPFVDLGVFGEYRISSRWSVWVQGANLLNEAIQTVPMHVEEGINFTAGVCLNL